MQSFYFIHLFYIVVVIASVPERLSEFYILLSLVLNFFSADFKE